ncbi:hypothetical protein GCM10010385_28410 [Streptomyces geysiriensis]|nr:hypothetical protein GCM10010385_28410 [Streptomyces geysiriensis]
MPARPQLADVLGQGGAGAAHRQTVAGGEGREVKFVGGGRGGGRRRCVEDLAHIRCFRSGEGVAAPGVHLGAAARSFTSGRDRIVVT